MTVLNSSISWTTPKVSTVSIRSPASNGLNNTKLADGAGVRLFGAEEEGDSDKNSDVGKGGSKEEPDTPTAQQHVRQFHINQVNKTDRKYNVRGVSLVGKFGHDQDGAQIIYPLGKYNKEVSLNHDDVTVMKRCCVYFPSL